MKTRLIVVLGTVVFSGFGYSNMCSNDIRYSTVCIWRTGHGNIDSSRVLSPSLIPNG